MKTLFFTLFFLGLFTLNPENIIQEDSDTKVTFKVKNMGIFVDGKFTDIAIESNFNKDDLNNSFIHAIIQVASLDTDNKKRDKDLMKSKYFDVNKFKEIKFISTKIEKSEGNKYKLTGNLTIKNITKLVSIPFEIIVGDSDQVISANFELNRKDYKVGGNSWVMSDEVFIEVKYLIK